MLCAACWAQVASLVSVVEAMALFRLIATFLVASTALGDSSPIFQAQLPLLRGLTMSEDPQLTQNLIHYLKFAEKTSASARGPEPVK